MSEKQVNMFWKKRKQTCRVCGKEHVEFPAIGFDTPFYYDGLTQEEKQEIAQISTDFCAIEYSDQTDRFIRTVLSIPIVGSCERLDYGIWVSVSEKTWDEYRRNFAVDSEPKTYFGMISNELNDYQETTLGLYTDVKTQKNGLRPEIIPHQSTHPLVSDWKNGISLAEAERRIQRIV